MNTFCGFRSYCDIFSYHFACKRNQESGGRFLITFEAQSLLTALENIFESEWFLNCDITKNEIFIIKLFCRPIKFEPSKNKIINLLIYHLIASLHSPRTNTHNFCQSINKYYKYFISWLGAGLLNLQVNRKSTPIYFNHSNKIIIISHFMSSIIQQKLCQAIRSHQVTRLF